MNATKRSRAWLLVMLALLAAMLAVVGCDGSDARDTDVAVPDSAPAIPVSDSAAPTAEAAARVRVEEMNRTVPAGLDPCRLAADVAASLDTIERWPVPLFRGDDACVLGMLDSLAGAFIRSGNEKYLAVLDTCGAYADGYVAEHFEEVATRLLERRPLDFIGYLAEKRARASALEWPLIVAWQRQFEGASDSTERRRALHASIVERVVIDSLAEPERAYFGELLRRSRMLE